MYILVIWIKQCSRYMKIEGHRRRSPAKCGSNKLLLVFIAIVVAFKDMVYIFYYEINLIYCKDTDVYQ